VGEKKEQQVNEIWENGWNKASSKAPKKKPPKKDCSRTKFINKFAKCLYNGWNLLTSNATTVLDGILRVNLLDCVWMKLCLQMKLITTM
jgi:hypothetical protein